MQFSVTVAPFTWGFACFLETGGGGQCGVARAADGGERDPRSGVLGGGSGLPPEHRGQGVALDLLRDHCAGNGVRNLFESCVSGG